MVGTHLQYQILKKISPWGPRQCDAIDCGEKSKLDALFGNNLLRHIAGKTIIDFGCGRGFETLELARRGAKLAIGIDIREDLMSQARQNALNAGLEGSVQFATSTNQVADIIISLDAFEHFENPVKILEIMDRLLVAGGEIILSFGPTWYHPYGAHLFSVFPWAHLLFREEALIRWRSSFKSDGATRFSEVAGGLNQMTIKRFESLVRQSRFTISHIELVPIKKLRYIHNRLTREFTTSIVRCRLIKGTTRPAKMSNG
jgi:SAM-dependent methyltransferase